METELLDVAVPEVGLVIGTQPKGNNNGSHVKTALVAVTGSVEFGALSHAARSSAAYPSIRWRDRIKITHLVGTEPIVLFADPGKEVVRELAAEVADALCEELVVLGTSDVGGVPPGAGVSVPLKLEELGPLLALLPAVEREAEEELGPSDAELDVAVEVAAAVELAPGSVPLVLGKVLNDPDVDGKAELDVVEELVAIPVPGSLLPVLRDVLPDAAEDCGVLEMDWDVTKVKVGLEVEPEVEASAVVDEGNSGSVVMDGEADGETG